ncbi:MAG: TIM barrel protein [bacterium]|nr:TIM barrel protein [bacterium]
MAELCFNTMNRSAYLLGDEDPDLLGQIDAAAAAGFRLFGPDEFSIARFRREGGRVEALAERMQALGMRTYELPTLMVNDDRVTTRAEIDRLAEIARILRPDFIQLNMDSKVDERVIDELRRAGDVFAGLGAGLAIEYLPWLPEVCSIDSTRAVLDRAQIEGAGVLVDTWHFTHSADTWEDLESLPLDELSYVQFDDHPPLESDDLVMETLMRRAMPGEGVFELDRFCDLLRTKGFDGVVSCEILSEQTRSMALETFAERVYSTSRRYWP